MWKTWHSELLFSSGDKDFKCRRYSQASKTWLAAFDERRADVETINRALRLANSLSKCDRFTDSLPIYLKAIDLNRKSAWPVDSSIALNELGCAYERNGQYDYAEYFFRKSIESGARKPTKNWHDAAYLNNLANLFFYQRRYADAERLYQEALLIRRREFGPDFPTTIHSMNQLANVYLQIFKYEAAEDLSLGVLKFKKKLLQTDGLSVATALDNLGKSYVCQKRYDEAIVMYIEALRICKIEEIKNQRISSTFGAKTSSSRFDLNTAFDCRPSSERLSDQLLAIRQISACEH